MSIRDTQDALIIEQPNSAAKIRDSQDVLIVELPQGNFGAAGHLRDSQDALIYEYPFVNAMFVYQAPGANALTGFTPTWPPVKKQPLYQWGLAAVRHDSVTVDGVKRSMLDRLDGVTTLSFPQVALSDMAAWKAFEQYALSGATFAYCPGFDPWATTDNTGFSTFRLINMDWTPHFQFFQTFSLEMKLLLVKDM